MVFVTLLGVKLWITPQGVRIDSAVNPLMVVVDGMVVFQKK